MIGGKLDKYDIIEKLGEGGMATVYKAVHTPLKRVVAIKVLHPHLSSSTRNRNRFAREAQTIEQLEHDNILRIFDYSGSTASDCYIVTEFVEGHTLQELLEEEGLLSSELVSLICLQLSRGLAYAHEENVIHRDIKPENVMVRNDGTVKLMDFGIAKVLEEISVTLTGSLIGSPAYMSPESVQEGKPDQRSDLFSLGSLMFYMLSGQVPFSGKNPSVIIRKVIEGDRPSLSELVPGADHRLITLIEHLLHPDVNERVQTASEVERALLEIINSNLGDADAETWSLYNWLSDRSSYNEALNIHLETYLLEQGKERLEKGRPLQAQRLFNRLLSLAPDNPEVIDLMVGLTDIGENRRRRTLSLYAGAGLLLLVSAVSYYVLQPKESSQNILEEPLLENVMPGPTATQVTTITDGTSAPNQGENKEVPNSILSDPNLGEPEDLTPVITTEIEAPEVPDAVNSSSTPLPNLETERVEVSRENLEIVETQLEEEADQNEQQSEAVTGTLLIGLDPENRGVWADVYVDGNSIGARIRAGGSPRAIEVLPGEHVVQISNDYANTHREQIVIEAGGTVEILNITLSRRPVTVRFPSDLNMSCEVFNGPNIIGSLQSIGYATRLYDEDLLSEIRIVCPNGVTLGPYDIRQPLPGEAVNFPP